MNTTRASENGALFLRTAILLVAWLLIARPSVANAQPAKDCLPNVAPRSQWSEGPIDIDLGGEATLPLPQAMSFVPTIFTMRTHSGLAPCPYTGGGVLSLQTPKFNSAVLASSSGWVSDKDAEQLDHADLLAHWRRIYAEDSGLRHRFIKPDSPQWLEAPRYDPVEKILRFSLVASYNYGNGESEVRYHVMRLTRRGSISVILNSTSTSIGFDRHVAEQLFSSIRLRTGNGYADFNPARDPVATGGLAAAIKDLN